MMTNWDYKVFDHKYNNLKRWFQAMEKNHPDGLNSAVLLGKIIGEGGMFDYLDKTQAAIDECVFKAIEEGAAK